MRTVLLLAVLALAATSAQADALPADMLGRWCFVSKMRIGDAVTGGPTYAKTYGRSAADCADAVISVELGPHSLDGLRGSVDEEGRLYVEGSPKPARKEAPR
jgi:hypothetical protein